eukprot:CAMPEP_0184698324 /NCGR_PEP_ID=MMETSP0313-20130426/4989_1 /TAXON_ID=2792 /ORGANISM="Porphyridium aerugineum, Strain SAG 1380-2" /LENGTH=800 /DNA_ID=CAMNT_0027157249 /DNA_START=91 /DNA_END=2493 /DNA_ORIENTATION=+
METGENGQSGAPIHRRERPDGLSAYLDGGMMNSLTAARKVRRVSANSNVVRSATGISAFFRMGIESESLLQRIRARSVYGSQIEVLRRFQRLSYESIVPSQTISDVESAPDVHFRRFTPDGNYLIAFARSLREVILYRMESGGSRFDFTQISTPLVHPDAFHGLNSPTSNGPEHLGQGRSHWLGRDHRLADGTQLSNPGVQIRVPQVESDQADTDGNANQVSNAEQGAQDLADENLRSQNSFHRFFSKVAEIPIPTGNEILCREFCLVTEDSRFLILGCWAPQAESAAASGEVAFARIPNLECVSLYLVDIVSGEIRDTYSLPNDFVLIESHQGVDLFSNILLLLSIRHQVLRFVEIRSSGTFREVRHIGDQCLDDDELLLREEQELARRFKSRAPSNTKEGGQGEAPTDKLNTSALQASTSMASQPGQAQTPVASENMEHGSGPITHPRNSPTGRASPPVTASPNGQLARSQSHAGHDELDSDEDDLDDMDLFTASSSGNVMSESPDGHLGRRGILHGGATLAEASHSMDNTQGFGLGYGLTRSRFFSGLMHKFLAHIWKRHQLVGTESRFFLTFNQYLSLVMLKAQFLDGNHLLLRLGSVEAISKTLEASMSVNWNFLVVYHIPSASIIRVYDNTTSDLLDLYVNYTEYFWRSYDLAPSKKDWENLLGGPKVLTKPNVSLNRMRSILSVIPISPQLKNWSPYLDRSLFSFDERRLASLEGSRPMPILEYPAVKFLSRRSGSLKFKLTPGNFSGVPSNVMHRDARRLAVFLFNPVYPFVLSIQLELVNMPQIVNFHFRD